jgi:hypothetical protein
MTFIVHKIEHKIHDSFNNSSCSLVSYSLNFLINIGCNSLTIFQFSSIILYLRIYLELDVVLKVNLYKHLHDLTHKYV